MSQHTNPGDGPVKAGSLFTLSARENLSAGYETLASFDPEALELMGTLSEHESGAGIGAAAVKVFQFKALRPGLARVSWRSRRPWESGEGSESGFALVQIE